VAGIDLDLFVEILDGTLQVALGGQRTAATCIGVRVPRVDGDLFVEVVDGAIVVALPA
jgi:hypothetical protein